LRTRRYNQAGLLADIIGKAAHRPVVIDAIIRRRATRALAELSADRRAAMVKGAFALRPSRAAAITGRRVILIDDVLTSGATAGECTHVLLGAGARSVDVLVAARTADPRNL
jgi:predicted amidophosphoribosyltransferase